MEGGKGDMEQSLEVKGSFCPEKLGSGAPSTQSLERTVRQQEGSRTGPTAWPTLAVHHP